jgi:probable HAF family extracellular repeat protein
VADAINERGQVVGWSSSAVDFGNDHAVLWENGKITDLGAPPLGVSQATGINNRGEIVGITQAFDALQQAALWANGATVELGRLPGATASHATEINERGQVVGLSGSPDDLWEHAVLWDRGEIIDLGTLPGGSRSSALAISESGAVAGSSDVANGESHAVVWERGVIRDLGAGVAFGINDRGQVVGQDGIGQPTLWTVK